MVEFALILFPLLIIVAGVIQFGIGLNYWLDMNRIANQGARFAAVNNWPGCERTDNAGSCTGTPSCTTPISTSTNQSLVNYLQCQAVSKGLRNSVTVNVCYPNDGDSTNDGPIGSPVQVTLSAPFKMVSDPRDRNAQSSRSSHDAARAGHRPSDASRPWDICRASGHVHDATRRTAA